MEFTNPFLSMAIILKIVSYKLVHVKVIALEPSHIRTCCSVAMAMTLLVAISYHVGACGSGNHCDCTSVRVVAQ